MGIRIVLADDHVIFLAGLRALLRAQPAMEVVGEARSGTDAVRVARDTGPDVVLMDVSMPGMNGVEATRQIVAGRPETRVLCLSMHADERFVAAVLQAGAAGYLHKDCDVQELVGAIRAVAAGRGYLSSSVAGLVIRGYTAHGPDTGSSTYSLLSDREREVLQLIAEGRPTKEIAARLHLSPKTVATHREHVMHKLEIHSVAGLTKYAVRHGLTTVERDTRRRH